METDIQSPAGQLHAATRRAMSDARTRPTGVFGCAERWTSGRWNDPLRRRDDVFAWRAQKFGLMLCCAQIKRAFKVGMKGSALSWRNREPRLLSRVMIGDRPAMRASLGNRNRSPEVSST